MAAGAGTADGFTERASFLEIQGRIAGGKTGLNLQIGGGLKAIFGWEGLHTLRRPLGVDKKPLSKRHSKGTIRVEETQGG
jgi:hypothetical protein